MSGSMIEQSESLFPYGDGFTSYEELLFLVNQRRETGVTNLAGAAVVWIPNENGGFDRQGVSILPDGSLNLAHAEYF